MADKALQHNLFLSPNSLTCVLTLSLLLMAHNGLLASPSNVPSMSQRQGLCTCYSFCLQCSSPRHQHQRLFNSNRFNVKFPETTVLNISIYLLILLFWHLLSLFALKIFFQIPNHIQHRVFVCLLHPQQNIIFLKTEQELLPVQITVLSLVLRTVSSTCYVPNKYFLH